MCHLQCSTMEIDICFTGMYFATIECSIPLRLPSTRSTGTASSSPTRIPG